MSKTSDALGKAKATLRREVLGRRDSIDKDAHRRLSQSILQKVFALRAYRRAGVVLAYAGFGSELQTDSFLRSVLGRV